MHQHHRRHRPVGNLRQGQCARQLPWRLADYDGFLRIIMRFGCGGGRGKVHSGNHSIPVQHHGAGQVDAGHQHRLRPYMIPLLILHRGIVSHAQVCPARRFQLRPQPGKCLLGQGCLHVSGHAVAQCAKSLRPHQHGNNLRRHGFGSIFAQDGQTGAKQHHGHHQANKTFHTHTSHPHCSTAD